MKDIMNALEMERDKCLAQVTEFHARALAIEKAMKAIEEADEGIRRLENPVFSNPNPVPTQVVHLGPERKGSTGGKGKKRYPAAVTWSLNGYVIKHYPTGCYYRANDPDGNYLRQMYYQPGNKKSQDSVRGKLVYATAQLANAKKG